jgi:hypothetical protein
MAVGKDFHSNLIFLGMAVYLSEALMRSPCYTWKNYTVLVKRTILFHNENSWKWGKVLIDGGPQNLDVFKICPDQMKILSPISKHQTLTVYRGKFLSR